MASETTNTEQTNSHWPRKLNKALIVFGVVAFGLIVTDRLLEAFRADDEPASTVGFQVPIDREEEPALAATPETPSTPKTQERKQSLIELENVFGSRIVFVSASEPAFVVTEDDRRFEVGSAIDEDTTLAGIMAHRLILGQADDMIVVSLPEPVNP